MSRKTINSCPSFYPISGSFVAGKARYASNLILDFGSNNLQRLSSSIVNWKMKKKYLLLALIFCSLLYKTQEKKRAYE